MESSTKSISKYVFNTIKYELNFSYSESIQWKKALIQIMLSLIFNKAEIFNSY